MLSAEITYLAYDCTGDTTLKVWVDDELLANETVNDQTNGQGCYCNYFTPQTVSISSERALSLLSGGMRDLYVHQIDGWLTYVSLETTTQSGTEQTVLFNKLPANTSLPANICGLASSAYAYNVSEEVPICREACDDGNTVNGDDCDSECRMEFCGNGLVEPGEECDDGNATSSDGCDVYCMLDSCGDGIQDAENL